MHQRNQEMATSTYAILLAISSILIFSISIGTSSSVYDNFLPCLSLNSQINIPPISQFVYSPNNASYSTILQSSIKNLRFLSSAKAKPQFIITPSHESHVQAAVVCSRKYDLQIRVVSGGHDFEGLSYTSDVPFIVIDLLNLRSITVDIEDNSAWVQAGATIGELYYRIAEKSRIHGFPAGYEPAVGVGGHFTGGGNGAMLRKYGLSIDHIIDASIVDVNGNILNRESMGEDLFWAIRGGGGASYGVILSFKIRLVSVPPTVTVFKIDKTLEQGATKLVHRWQYIANNLHKDLSIMVFASVNSEKKTINILFYSLFLGGVERLLPLMEESFPELGLERKDCIEMSWIESVLYLARFSSEDSLDVLLNRNHNKLTFKGKSDYVKTPIPEVGLEGIWNRTLEGETSYMIFVPFGGIMSEISESETPFPHRAGYIYMLAYTSIWSEEGNLETKMHIDGIRRLHNYLTPYVSKSPRGAYLNYRDLDLGINKYGNTSYSQAMIWGSNYFNNNFKRLARVKTKVDPDNFFWNEQSIPTIPRRRIKKAVKMTWVE